MADRDIDSAGYRETYVERDTVRKSGGGISVLAFIVGGLVVLALVFFWFFSGGDLDGTAGTAGGAGSDVSVTVQDGADAPAADAPAAPAPAMPRVGVAPAYQCPVFFIDAQGSAGAFDSPSCRSSIEMPSGERTKAM